MIQCGFGDGAHQAVRAPAIDQAHAILGEDLSERGRAFNKVGIGAWAGAAVDTDSFDLVHDCHVALQRKSVKPIELATAAELIRKCLNGDSEARRRRA